MKYDVNFFVQGSAFLVALRDFKKQNHAEQKAVDPACYIKSLIDSVQERLMFSVDLDKDPAKLVEHINRFVAALWNINDCRGYSLDETLTLHDHYRPRDGKGGSVSRRYRDVPTPQNLQRQIDDYDRLRKSDIGHAMFELINSVYGLIGCKPAIVDVDPVLSYVANEFTLNKVQFSQLIRSNVTSYEGLDMTKHGLGIINIRNHDIQLVPVTDDASKVNIVAKFMTKRPVKYVDLSLPYPSRLFVETDVMTSEETIDCVTWQPCSLQDLSVETRKAFDRAARYFTRICEDIKNAPPAFIKQWLDLESYRQAIELDALEAELAAATANIAKLNAKKQKMLESQGQIKVASNTLRTA